jgi:DUF2905 family protein
MDGGASGIGRTLIVAGAVLLLVGLVFTLGGKIPWLGRLPGDLVWRRGGFTLYLPIVTCLLLSLLLTAIFSLLRR